MVCHVRVSLTGILENDTLFSDTRFDIATSYIAGESNMEK